MFVLFRNENLRKAITNITGINPFKWIKYVLWEKLEKVAKYAWIFSIFVSFFCLNAVFPDKFEFVHRTNLYTFGRINFAVIFPRQ